MTMLEFSFSPRLKDSNFQNIEESEYFDSSESHTFKVTKLFADHAGGWALKGLYTCNQTKTNEATGESFSFDVIIRSRASISTTVNRKRLTYKHELLANDKSDSYFFRRARHQSDLQKNHFC